MADNPKFRHYRRFEPGIFVGVATAGIHRGKLVLNADTLTTDSGAKTRPARFSPVNLREFPLEPEKRYQITLWRKSEHNSRLLEAEPLPDPEPKPEPAAAIVIGPPEPVALDLARVLLRLVMHDKETAAHMAAVVERLAIGGQADEIRDIHVVGDPQPVMEPDGRPRGSGLVGDRNSRQASRSRVRSPRRQRAAT